jgi:ribonuclease PH
VPNFSTHLFSTNKGIRIVEQNILPAADAKPSQEINKEKRQESYKKIVEAALRHYLSNNHAGREEIK